MEFFIQKSGYNLLRCPSCGLIRTDLGKPYGEFIREFYTTGYFQGDIAKSAYRNYQKDKPYIVKNMRMFLSAIQKRKQRGTLLDVGCAYGFFVELAIQHGFDAYGIDPSADAIEKADPKIRNRLTKGTSSEHMHKPAFFDVITMLDVFEHLGDPIGDLKKLRTLLKDDGILLIATGDTGSLAARILKRRWTFYIPPQHTFFFNKKNFTETLKQAGFAPFSFFRIGKWLSLSYVLHLARTTGESKVASVLQKTVERCGIGSLPLYIPMGDNMVVMARKQERLGNAL